MATSHQYSWVVSITAPLPNPRFWEVSCYALVSFGVAFLGIVVPATTIIAHLMIIPTLIAIRSNQDLFRGSQHTPNQVD